MSPYRKPPRTPPGCEDHLTRHQAAHLLGFSSEFKIRQLEREGRLQSVRGPRRTAFYARAQVLAIKAELGPERLGQERPGQASPGHDGWTDAELLLLLASPSRDGKPRTALDLVLQTRISIERAERVYAFWSNAHGAETEATTSPFTTQRGSAPAPMATSSSFVVAEPLRTPPPSAEDGNERRSERRRSRDNLIEQLRDPDPRVRDHAFALLKQFQAGG